MARAGCWAARTARRTTTSSCAQTGASACCSTKEVGIAIKPGDVAVHSGGGGGWGDLAAKRTAQARGRVTGS